MNIHLHSWRDQVANYINWDFRADGKRGRWAFPYERLVELGESECVATMAVELAAEIRMMLRHGLVVGIAGKPRSRIRRAA